MSHTLPPSGKPLDADEYAARHDAELDFESVCLTARQQHNLAQVRALQPATVLEVGCGPELLSLQALADPEHRITQWVAVEPAQRWADAARAESAREPRLAVVHAYIERADAALSALWGNAPGADLLIVSGVIHETSEPETLLRAGLRWLKPGGHLLVSVPNALSFHRLLAVQMGLMEAPEVLSERNRLLGQPRVYRPQDLRDLVLGLEPGLAEVALDGYLFKPFTHAQMATLLPSLGEPGVQGLIELGRRFPMQAAEIALLARKAG
ncbi:methyltransferase domain-containing protein [Ideonella sp. DXS29W]|uniref:Methyltransferase domain-containing protein n=1 Tax=Ideonella lacteola TaxID=2984193 RepID=A0ABU9BMH7_9BURK